MIENFTHGQRMSLLEDDIDSRGEFHSLDVVDRQDRTKRQFYMEKKS